MKQLEFTGLPTPLQHQLYIDMRYQPAASNNETGKRRLHCTIKYAARLGIISPIFISWLYGINRTLALEHLNKLVKAGLLNVAPTVRVPDGRVYVLTLSGAKLAEELLLQHVPFRSSTNPQLQINQNTLMHDVILQYVLARGIQNVDGEGNYRPQWTGFISEKEFKRLYPSSTIRNVDGLVIEPDGACCAIEIEHSYKPIQIRKNILLKYRDALQDGLYDKVFFISQSLQILQDSKRINGLAMDTLTSIVDRKTDRPLLSDNDRKLLEDRLIYRTKFCEEISSLFYQ